MSLSLHRHAPAIAMLVVLSMSMTWPTIPAAAQDANAPDYEAIVAAPDRQIRTRRVGFSARVRPKIALRGQDQDRCGRDQKQIIRWRGSAGHQASLRGACCRRLVAAQPSNVANKIRPAGMALWSRGRDFAFSRLRLARGSGDEGASKTAAAVRQAQAR